MTATAPVTDLVGTGRPAGPPPSSSAAGRKGPRPPRRTSSLVSSSVLYAALVALALYAAAPGLADKGPVGAALMRWHAQVDEGRGWLDGRADALLAMLGRR